MNLKQAKLITGGLSSPSKLSCKSYSLPAEQCRTGMKLRKIKGSICSKCYAQKGRYKVFGKNIKPAQYKRLDSLDGPQWVEAMTALISHYSSDKFRWHDSGDIQNERHLKQMMLVAGELPDTEFWITTKEYAAARLFFKTYADKYRNTALRVSSPMIGRAPLDYPLTCTSGYNEGVQCSSYLQDGKCLDCTMCWDRNIKNINYKMH